jgi:tetratricopeptide (TPR) repeat protein
VSDDNVIHVDFGAGPPRSLDRSERDGPSEPSRGEERRRLRPATPPDPGAQPRVNDPLGDLYSVRDAAKLFGLTPGRLRYWERSGFIERSARKGDRRYYSFQDLISIRAARELLAEGIPLQQVRQSIESLRASLPRIARPLSALRIQADGQTLVVRDERGDFEASTGQMRLGFDVSALRDDVVRVLRRGGRRSDFGIAYQHYLEGCRLDQTETTFDRAEAAYRRAIELDPSLGNAYTNLGNLLYRRGEMDEAETLYVRALKIDVEQPEAHYNLGFLRFERGELQGAVQAFRRALRSDPSFADAHFNLAMALTELEQPQQARGHWKTYLKLDPDSPWADIARRHLDC